MHDRIAELGGLRAELANCENGPRESRRTVAAEVRKEIARVRGELEEHARALERRVEELTSNGQDVPAAEAAVAARAIRTELDVDEPAPAKARPAGTAAKQTAAAAKPPQTT
jgi:hypothetical protein